MWWLFQNPITLLEKIMATLVGLQADVAKLQGDVTTLVGAMTSVRGQLADAQSQIAALQAQIAAGSPVTQEQLDALDASVQGIDGTIVAALPTSP